MLLFMAVSVPILMYIFLKSRDSSDLYFLLATLCFLFQGLVADLGTSVDIPVLLALFGVVFIALMFHRPKTVNPSNIPSFIVLETKLKEANQNLKTLEAIPEEVETIWEIGCAEGAFTQLLLEQGKRVWGVDVSPTALSRAQERLKNFGDRVHLQKLDIVREDIEGTFDLILASEVLYYLGGKEILQPLEDKFYRHLRPSGYLLLCHFYPSGKIIHDLYQENQRFCKVFEEITYHPHRDYIITLLKKKDDDPVIFLKSPYSREGGRALIEEQKIPHLKKEHQEEGDFQNRR
jgi:SAM-dependent methyltransferase